MSCEGFNLAIYQLYNNFCTSLLTLRNKTVAIFNIWKIANKIQTTPSETKHH